MTEAKLQYQREWRARNKLKLAEYSRRSRGYFLEWRIKHLDYRSPNATENRERWRKNNRIKHRAHSAVWNALRSGKLLRPLSCSSCGTQCKPQGHHPDYSKPLEVIWLCRPCHALQGH